MKNTHLENELRKEVNKMMPENMVATIKNANVKPKKVVNKNISVINEKSRHSIVPIIASCIASVIICLAVFLPIAIKGKEDYNNWLSNQRQEQEIEENNQDNE